MPSHRRCARRALANDAELVNREGRWRVQGDPTEGALVVAARKFGISGAELERFPRIAEIPFTSERKRHTTVHLDRENPGELCIFVKGAPEVLLANSRYLWEGGKIVPLGEDRRADISRRNDALAAQALRTLAIATRTVPAASLGVDPQAAAANRTSTIELPDSIEDDLVLLGLVGMIDPPRAEAKVAVAIAKRAHIRSVMITGDHPATAEAIARELEIFEPGARTVTGVEMRTMEDAELDAIVEQVRVFARVDPEHKLRIVGALQRKGHIVAMTGDGINDAPALKTANIGVAMGITGTDVSKEAADMVLTDDNFASIVKAIEEGRGVYANIRKYLIYLLSSNAGELLTMFAGVMFAGVLGLTSAEPGLFLPLLAAQLLWINLITDGPPALALGVDPKDPDVMEREPRQRGTGVLTMADWWYLAGVGSVMMVGTLAVLDAYYPGGLFTLFAKGTGPNTADETYARTMAFTTLMMFQLFNVYNCRSGLAQRLQRILRKQMAAWRSGLLAVLARARDLRSGPPDRLPYRAAVGARLASRDGRRGDAARSDGGGQTRVARAAQTRTYFLQASRLRRIAVSRVKLGQPTRCTRCRRKGATLQRAESWIGY